jgi:hypothetical protein
MLLPYKACAPFVSEKKLKLKILSSFGYLKERPEGF